MTAEGLHLVTKEVAKLAEELGFILPCAYAYDDGKVRESEDSFYTYRDITIAREDNPNYEYYLMPTQARLQQWIADKLKFQLTIGFSTAYNMNQISAFHFEIHDLMNGMRIVRESNFKTYHEALEQGLKTTLESYRVGVIRNN